MPKRGRTETVLVVNSRPMIDQQASNFSMVT